MIRLKKKKLRLKRKRLKLRKSSDKPHIWMAVATRIDGIVIDRFFRFKYNGVIWGSGQFGVRQDARIVLRPIDNWFPYVNHSSADIEYLERRGIKGREDWKKLNMKVPKKLLNGTEAILFRVDRNRRQMKLPTRK